MKPFTRETVTDRRQPAVRWNAVIAGSLVALGTWVLLQLLITGAALTAIDADHVDRLGSYSIGTSVGSILAPLLAMFAGGLVAGRLASFYDGRVSAFHGALVWTIASGDRNRDARRRRELVHVAPHEGPHADMMDRTQAWRCRTTGPTASSSRRWST